MIDLKIVYEITNVAANVLLATVFIFCCYVTTNFFNNEISKIFKKQRKTNSNFRSVLLLGFFFLFKNRSKEKFKMQLDDKYLYQLIPIVLFAAALLPIINIPLHGAVQLGFMRLTYNQATSYESLFVVLLFVLITVVKLLPPLIISRNDLLRTSLANIVQEICADSMLIIACLSAFLSYETWSFTEMVSQQSTVGQFGFPLWGVVIQPQTAVLVFFAVLLKSDDHIFGFTAVEQNYRIEYRSFGLAILRASDYAYRVGMSVFFAVVFLGGHDVGWLEGLWAFSSWQIVVLQFMVLFFKVIVFSASISAAKWLLPDLRKNSMMNVAWNNLVPLGVLNLVGIIVYQYWKNI